MRRKSASNESSKKANSHFFILITLEETYVPKITNNWKNAIVCCWGNAEFSAAKVRFLLQLSVIFDNKFSYYLSSNIRFNVNWTTVAAAKRCGVVAYRRVHKTSQRFEVDDFKPLKFKQLISRYFAIFCKQSGVIALFQWCQRYSGLWKT